METERDWFGDVLKIALGIALGGLILWRLSVLYLHYQVQQAADEIHAQADLMAHKLSEQQRQRNALVQDAGMVEQRHEAERVQALVAADDLRQRKEEAWKLFYHPASECLDTTRSDVSIQCGNAYIRLTVLFVLKVPFWANSPFETMSYRV